MEQSPSMSSHKSAGGHGTPSSNQRNMSRNTRGNNAAGRFSGPALERRGSLFQIDQKCNSSQGGVIRVRRAEEHPLKMMTVDIKRTYKLCNPAFVLNPSMPRRVLTNPSKGVANGGLDNADANLICSVNDELDAPTKKYIVLDLLGQGTFGQVFRCQDTLTREVVAIKVVKNKPAYRNQALIEIQVARLLNEQHDPTDSKHIVRLMDCFPAHNHLCLVFELLSVNIYELLKSNQFRGLPLHMIRHIVHQIIESLTVLEEAKIIHCDLKPENILTVNKPRSGQSVLSGTAKKEGTSSKGSSSSNSPSNGSGLKFVTPIKLIDFGSACFEGHTMYSYIQSRFYRSPEVLLGLPYDGAIDMWSLGCICVEMFLGLPIFPGVSDHNQMARIVEMVGPPPDFMLDNGKDTQKFFKKVPIGGQPSSSNSGLIRGRDAGEGNMNMNNNMNINNNAMDMTSDMEGLGLESTPGQAKGFRYVLKLPDEYARDTGTQVPVAKKYFKHSNIPDIINSYPMSHRRRGQGNPKETERELEREREELDARRMFIHFCLGLLQQSPLKRWTPRQALCHPFITEAPAPADLSTITLPVDQKTDEIRRHRHQQLLRFKMQQGAAKEAQQIRQQQQQHAKAQRELLHQQHQHQQAQQLAAAARVYMGSSPVIPMQIQTPQSPYNQHHAQHNSGLNSLNVSQHGGMNSLNASQHGMNSLNASQHGMNSLNASQHGGVGIHQSQGRPSQHAAQLSGLSMQSYQQPGTIGQSTLFSSQPIDVPAHFSGSSSTVMGPAGPALYYGMPGVVRQAGSYDPAAQIGVRIAEGRAPPSAYSFSYTHKSGQPVPDFGFALQRPTLCYEPQLFQQHHGSPYHQAAIAQQAQIPTTPGSLGSAAAYARMSDRRNSMEQTPGYPVNSLNSVAVGGGGGGGQAASYHAMQGLSPASMYRNVNVQGMGSMYAGANTYSASAPGMQWAQALPPPALRGWQSQMQTQTTQQSASTSTSPATSTSTSQQQRSSQFGGNTLSSSAFRNANSSTNVGADNADMASPQRPNPNPNHTVINIQEGASGRGSATAGEVFAEWDPFFMEGIEDSAVQQSINNQKQRFPQSYPPPLLQARGMMGVELAARAGGAVCDDNMNVGGEVDGIHKRSLNGTSKVEKYGGGGVTAQQTGNTSGNNNHVPNQNPGAGNMHAQGGGDVQSLIQRVRLHDAHQLQHSVDAGGTNCTPSDGNSHTHRQEGGAMGGNSSCDERSSQSSGSQGGGGMGTSLLGQQLQQYQRRKSMESSPSDNGGSARDTIGVSLPDSFFGSQMMPLNSSMFARAIAPQPPPVVNPNAPNPNAPQPPVGNAPPAPMELHNNDNNAGWLAHIPGAISPPPSLGNSCTGRRRRRRSAGPQSPVHPSHPSYFNVSSPQAMNTQQHTQQNMPPPPTHMNTNTNNTSSMQIGSFQNNVYVRPASAPHPGTSNLLERGSSSQSNHGSNVGTSSGMIGMSNAQIAQYASALQHQQNLAQWNIRMGVINGTDSNMSMSNNIDTGGQNIHSSMNMNMNPQQMQSSTSAQIQHQQILFGLQRAPPPPNQGLMQSISEGGGTGSASNSIMSPDMGGPLGANSWWSAGRGGYGNVDLSS